MLHPYAGRQPNFRGFRHSTGLKTSLIFLSALSPALIGDNMLLRELVAINSTPYLKRSLLPRASILWSLSADKLPYTVSHPPHSTQGKLSTQAARVVRLKREGEGSSSKPGAHCPAERGELSSTFVLSDGSGIGQDHWYLLCSPVLF